MSEEECAWCIPSRERLIVCQSWVGSVRRKVVVNREKVEGTVSHTGFYSFSASRDKAPAASYKLREILGVSFLEDDVTSKYHSVERLVSNWPMLCCMAILQFGTCRFPHFPRSWFDSSTTWATPKFSNRIRHCVGQSQWIFSHNGTCSSDWMALGNEPARWINHPLSSVGVIASVNDRASFA